MLVVLGWRLVGKGLVGSADILAVDPGSEFESGVFDGGEAVASAERSPMLDSPASSFRSIKDEDHPFDLLDQHIKRDSIIPVSSKGLVIALLDPRSPRPKKP